MGSPNRHDTTFTCFGACHRTVTVVVCICLCRAYRLTSKYSASCLRVLSAVWPSYFRAEIEGVPGRLGMCSLRSVWSPRSPPEAPGPIRTRTTSSKFLSGSQLRI